MRYSKVSFENIDISGGFWKQRYDLNAKTTINQVYDRFKESNRFAVISRVWEHPFVASHIFYDSDTAKWIESVGFLLSKNRELYKDLEQKADQIIDSFAKLQNKNGYVNSYFQRHLVIKFSNRDRHELYCLGHLIEASIAYYKATGKDKLLKVVEKYIDYVIKRFQEKQNTSFSTPGHEEIELALYKLFEFTNKEKYKKLAEFFLNTRGTKKEYATKCFSDIYYQSDKPIRELSSAKGHAVRAMYLYSAMSDMARINSDKDVLKACNALWEDTIKKMYITGGIGSFYVGECFTIPYDLPNTTAYTESCACIGLMFFAHRMQLIDNKSEYAEIIERIMYNNLLSSTSLDGRAFFYENPLEIDIAERKRSESVKDNTRYPITERKEVFGCSCCPPNITRIMASIGDYIYTLSDEAIILQQWVASNYQNGNTSIKISTDYPNGNDAKIVAFEYDKPYIMLRIPPFLENVRIKVDGEEIGFSVENGYVKIEVKCEFQIDVCWKITPKYVYPHPKIKSDIGKVALSFGPIIYCLEGVDNGDLSSIAVDINEKIEVVKGDSACLPLLKTNGYLLDSLDTYFYDKPSKTPKPLTFIPYYTFANRGESDMKVFVPKL